MNCPYCNSSQIIVANSRSTRGNTQIWRRRKCLSCHKLFTTYENIDLSYLVVIKKSGKRERYNRAKLFSSIYHAAVFEKNVDRGESGSLTEEITKEVEKEILLLKKKKIKSSEIFEITLKNLKKENFNIYLRYVSYFQKVSKQLF
jgi:transcriptional repressor NrdR